MCAAAAFSTEAPTWELANSMSVQYNLWAQERNRATEGTVSATEFLQWQRVKAAWRQMEKRVDAEYRGERNR
jgi:hypothetical protein